MRQIGNFAYDAAGEYITLFIIHVLETDEWLETFEPMDSKELTVVKNINELSEVLREFNINIWQMLKERADIETYKRVSILYKRCKITENKRIRT